MANFPCVWPGPGASPVPGPSCDFPDELLLLLLLLWLWLELWLVWLLVLWIRKSLPGGCCSGDLVVGEPPWSIVTECQRMRMRM